MENHGNNVLVKLSTGSVLKVLLYLVLFYVVYLLRDIALVVLTAIVIASAIEPAAKWLQNKRIPRVVAVVFIYFSIIALLLVIFYFLLPTLLTETYNFLSNLDSVQFGDPLKGLLGSQGTTGTFIEHFSLKDIILSIQSVLSGFSGGFLSTVSAVFGGALSFILILVLSFYFTVQEDGVTDFLKVIVPVERQQYVVGLWRRSQEKIGFWLQGQLLLGLLVGVFVYLGLTILGVKHTLLLAVLAAIFEIIPLFGPILSAIPGIATAFVYGGVTLGLVVTGLYLIIQQFENHLIYPLVVNKVVGVSPVLVIIALLVGGKLAGFLGILLSVPIAAALMEYYSDVRKEKILAFQKS